MSDSNLKIDVIYLCPVTDGSIVSMLKPLTQHTVAPARMFIFENDKVADAFEPLDIFIEQKRFSSTNPNYS